ncbi:MAG: PEP-CTERM sorting domain-containing protein [Sedimentisphaerales bacterium]|jgi:hypothetical protein
MKKLITLCVFAVLPAVLVLPMGAGACLIQYSVTVIAGSDVAVFSGTGETSAHGYFECSLVNSEQVIGDAFIESLKLKINSDPEVGVEFGVRAGASETPFHLLSDVVAFSPIVNPTASALASVTLTDRSPAGATITGLFPGGWMHQARYNSSAVFANLVNSFSIPGGTLTKEEEKGNEFSMITINDTLTSIESEFWFTLSAKDSSAGTSTFVVEEVPEPATICMLGLGALSFLRKKK